MDLNVQYAPVQYTPALVQVVKGAHAEYSLVLRLSSDQTVQTQDPALLVGHKESKFALDVCEQRWFHTGCLERLPACTYILV